MSGEVKGRLAGISTAKLWYECPFLGVQRSIHYQASEGSILYLEAFNVGLGQYQKIPC